MFPMEGKCNLVTIQSTISTYHEVPTSTSVLDEYANRNYIALLGSQGNLNS